MIETPSKNVELTFEQLQQIDVVQKNLANLHNETSIATKLLIVTRKDTEKATKEKVYQEELLADLKIKTEVAEDKLKKVLSALESSEITLKDNIEKAKTVGIANETKNQELYKKEIEIKVSEEQYQKNVEDFNIKFNQLLEDQLSINTAKNAFLKAIETVKWK